MTASNLLVHSLSSDRTLRRGAVAFGALALAASAIGALAIGRLAVVPSP